MADIIITIKDQPDGTIMVRAEGDDALATYAQTGHAQTQTRAQHYAIAAWQAMVWVSQQSPRPDELVMQ